MVTGTRGPSLGSRLLVLCCRAHTGRGHSCTASPWIPKLVHKMTHPRSLHSTVEKLQLYLTTPMPGQLGSSTYRRPAVASTSCLNSSRSCRVQVSTGSLLCMQVTSWSTSSARVPTTENAQCQKRSKEWGSERSCGVPGPAASAHTSHGTPELAQHSCVSTYTSYIKCVCV